MLPLILGGISLAAQAWGAHKQASAAKKAGEQQARAAADARRAYDQSYQVQQGLLDPQAALGRQSMNTLGRLMQPGVAYSPQMQAQDAMAFQNAPSPWMMQQPIPPTVGQRPMPGQPAPVAMAAPPPQFMPFARPALGPSRIPPARPIRRAMRLGDLDTARRA